MQCTILTMIPCLAPRSGIRRLLVLVAFVLGTSFAYAATYYVAPSGNDSNSGLLTTAPLATPQAALNKALPGDTVLLRGGTYTFSNGSTPLRFSTAHRGSDTSWLVVKNYPGETPVIQITRAGAVWNAIELHNAAYVEISGLTLLGWNDEITLAEAKTDAQSASASPVYNGNAISADGRDRNGIVRNSTNRPRHLRVLGNTVRKFPGAGISFIQSDYINTEGNTVQDCAWYTRYGSSGISIFQPWNYDTSTADYRIRVIGNRCFGNKTLVEWVEIGALSDGNGIIIDDGRNTQDGSTRGAYTGRILVANNLVVNNGGSGIHSYVSDKVDIVHNTAYYNGQVLNYGEIFSNESGNVRIYNNICVARPDRAINKQNPQSTNLDYRGNIYYGGYANAAYYTANNTTADPRFANPSTDPTTADFSLLGDSPALNAALTTLNGTALPWVSQLTTDLSGGSRTVGTGPDAGAYERTGRPLPTTGLVLTGNNEPILADDAASSAANATAFGQVEINLPAANAPLHTFTLTNRDTVNRTVSSLSLSGAAAFTLVNAPALPLVLAPGASTSFGVRCLPTTAGAQSATLSLVHNSPNTTNPFTCILDATGATIPAAGLSTGQLGSVRAVSTSGTHNGLTLTNPGSAPLTWNASLPGTYTVADSLSPDGPAYNWIDISTSGTAINFPSVDDSYSNSIAIGFPFRFYGVASSNLTVNTNGHLTLDTSNANQSAGYYLVKPLASAISIYLPSRSIAALWDDLYVDGSAKVVYRQLDATTFVVSWLNVTYFADINAATKRRLSFQVILKQDGTVTVQYQGVAKPQNAYLLGLINTVAGSLSNGATNDINQFVQYANTQNPINANLAVRYTPPPRAISSSVNYTPGASSEWAKLTGATSGTLAPGSSVNLPVLFNATNLVTGSTYNSRLTLNTNDPAEGTLYVPVSLTVGATANLSPSVALTTPARPTTFPGVGLSVPLAAGASDTDGSISQVEFLVNGSVVATDTTAPYTANWVSATPGTFAVQARATDNLGSTALSQPVDAAIVNLPPTVALTAPVNGSTAPLGTTVTLQVNATDTDVGTISKVEYYNGTTLLGISTTTPFSLNWSPTTLGSVTFTAKAYDAYGASATSSPITFSVVRPDLPTSGLLAYWRFNETSGLTAADLSGNARNATLADTTNTTWTSAGKFSNALGFNGNNSARASFDHPALGALSVSAWVWGDSTGQQFPRILCLPGSGTAGAGGYNFFLRRSLGTDANYTGGVGFTDGTGGDWATTGTGNTLVNGTWHHVVVTFDGAVNSAGPAIYVNGVARSVLNNVTTVRTATPTVIASTSTLKGLIGNRIDTPRPWRGQIDQVRLYNRVLTVAEVSALYLDDGGPLAPASLTATPSATGVTLAWATVTSTNATVTYRVARSLSASGPFTTLASNLTATGFTDTTTTAGATYYYTVTATAAGDTGPIAGPATATVWTGLQAWRMIHFGTIFATGNAASQADPDGDGIGNLLEYALGGDPTNSASAPIPSLQVVGVTPQPSYLQLTFLRARTDLTYTVEGSSTLDPNSWLPVPFTLSPVGTLSTATDAEPITARRFLRLRITAP